MLKEANKMSVTSFQKRLTSDRPLFIPFIVAGDPHPDATVELALSLQESGASILELGIPYSDPLADGPIIQEAAKRALKHGMTLKKGMELVSVMRKKGLKIPVIIFTYYNPVLQLGEESFFALARENDIDGLLVPDLPFEESGEIRERCKAEGVELISLVAPTSHQRIKQISENAQGFLYCVSSLGVTGVRDTFHEGVYDFLGEVKKYSNVPVAVGFGISRREHVLALRDHCDGIVIGSAIIKKVEELGNQLADESTRKSALNEFERFILSIIGSNSINEEIDQDANQGAIKNT